MKKYIYTSICILGLAAGYVHAQTAPLRLVEKIDFAGMTKVEKEHYVAGVLEGQSFLMYASDSKDLKPFVQCITNEGIEKITKATETVLVFDTANSPIPWAIARAIGIICNPYR